MKEYENIIGKLAVKGIEFGSGFDGSKSRGSIQNDVWTVDKDGNMVFLAESKWVLKTVQESFPEIKFHFTSEF